MDQKPEQRLSFSPKSLKNNFEPCKELSGWTEDLKYRSFADPVCTPPPIKPLKVKKSARYSRPGNKPLVTQSYSYPKDSAFSPYYTHFYPNDQPEPVFTNKLIQSSLGHSLFPTHNLNIQKRYKSIFERKKSKIRDFYYKNSIVGHRSPPAVSGLSVTFYYR
jgi:hypothetical protein